MTPHVARKRKGSAIDGRTTRPRGYAMSIHVRKRIESIFGWMKTVGGMRKTRFRGLERVGLHFSLVATAYNLVHMARLGGSLMGVLRPEFRKWPEKTEKTATISPMGVPIHPFSIKSATATAVSRIFSAAS